MGVLKSELLSNALNNELENCAANHAYNFYKGKPSNASRFDAINRIREALRRLGFPTNDPPGEYGGDTARAVLTYKGPPRNILGPGQRTSDAVVGRKTIVQLDADLQAAGLGGEMPSPPAPPSPSILSRAVWGYQLLTFTKVHLYLVTFQSVDKLQYGHFRIRHYRAGVDVEVSGGTSADASLNPSITMSDRVGLDEFDDAVCDIRLQRDQRRNGGMLSGTISIFTRKGLVGRSAVPAYGEGSGDGSWWIVGRLFGPIDLPGVQQAPLNVNASHLSHIYRTARRL